MSRKMRCLCLILSMLLLMAGCSEQKEIVATNAVYDIIRRGDQYSIRLKENSEYWMGYESNDLITWAESMPKYKDLASMKQDILKGDFTKDEFFRYTHTYRKAKIDSREALICNPYELYRPYVPTGMIVNDEVKWCVSSYYFTFTGDQVTVGSGGVDVLVKKEYSSYISEFNDGFADIKESAQKENPSVHIVEEKVDLDTGERRIHYTRTYRGGKVSGYLKTREVYETPEKTLHIEYEYHDYTGDENAKPYQIRIYGEENGGYFCFVLYSIKENVDAQWLSQFGITPYEGNESAPKAIG